MLEGARAIVHFIDGPAAGKPAITRNAVGDGSAWYLSTRLDGAALESFVDARAGRRRLAVTRPANDVEVVERVADDGTRYRIVVNHSAVPAAIGVAGHDLATGEQLGADATVGAGGVRVIRRSASTAGPTTPR